MYDNSGGQGGIDVAFETEKIKELSREMSELLDKAQETKNELSTELSGLYALLEQVPSDCSSARNLQNSISSLNNTLKGEDYTTYKSNLQNNLNRIAEEMSKGDAKSAQKLSETCRVLDQVKQDAQKLKEIIPKTEKGMNYYKFEQNVADYYTKRLESYNNGNDLQETTWRAAEMIACLKGDDLSQVKSSADPVNLSTGNFYYDYSDLTIDGEPAIQLRRFYNALLPRDGVLGRGWQHPYDVRLLIEEEQVIIIRENGQEELFQKTGNEKYRCADTRNKLHKTETGYQYEQPNGMIQSFDSEGKYLCCVDGQGSRLTCLYEENHLQKVTREQDGAALLFSYNENDRLETVQDDTGRTVTYRYDENGQLTEVCNILGEIYRYRYDKEGHLSVIESPANIKLVTTEYDESGRAVRQTFPDQSSMTFSYDDENGEVLLCERDGSKTVYCHNERYQNVKVRYEDGTEESDLYNRKGQLITHKDPLGRATRYAYDAHGNLTQVIDPLGNKCNATYNKNHQMVTLSVNGVLKQKNLYNKQGNLQQRIDALGRKTEFFYDKDGREERIQFADGSSLSFSYDERGNQTSVADIYGNRTDYKYDNLNRVIEEQDTQKGITYYTYDNSNRIVKMQENGFTTEYRYHTNGQLTAAVWEGGNVNADYNEVGCIKSKTDANGNTIEYLYNEMWKLKEIHYPNGGRMTFCYNKKGELESKTDVLGHTTTYEYDAVGNLISEKTEGLGEAQYCYDELDRLISYTDMDGNTTSYEYDEENNLTGLINPKGDVKRYVYNAAGELTEETNEVGYTLYYTYTALGQLESIRDDVSELLHREYAIGGRLIRTEQIGRIPATYEYDRFGNISKVSLLSGDEIFYQYDKNGKILKISNANGWKEEYTYQGQGFLKTEKNKAGDSKNYRYDANGNLISLIDELGNESIYCYDTMNQLAGIERYEGKAEKGKQTAKLLYQRDLSGQVLSVTDEIGRSETYTYHPTGRMQSKTDRDGNLTTYQYSAEGKLLEIHYADGRESRFAYECNGAVRQIDDWVGTTVFENDALGRVLKTRYPNGEEAGYRYSLRGERTGILYPDGTKCEYTYDKGGHLCELRDGTDRICYQYDSYGRLSRKLLPGGVETEYGYTKEGYLESIATKNADGLLYEQHRYTYDIYGQRTGVIRDRLQEQQTSGHYTYDYDKAGRLQTVQKDGMPLRSYVYDTWGNRQSKTEFRNGTATTTYYEYNKAGELVREKNEETEYTYHYDQRGNLIESYQDGSLDKKYVYDCRNRLSEATDRDGTAVHYLYHSLGYRLQRTEHTTDGKERCADYTVDFTKKANNLLTETYGEQQYRYLWDGRAAVQKGEDASRYYLTDELGSPIRLLDESGEILETYGYTEFGEALCQDSLLQPFTYTGYQKDAVSESYFAQAREYSPMQGRFLAEDIVRGDLLFPQSLNHYAYCYNSPMMYVDENGEMPVALIGAGIGGLWEGVSTVVEAKVKGEKVDWKEAGISFVKGAIKGAVATTGIGLAGSAAIDGLVDGVGDIATQMIVEGKSWNETDKKHAVKVGGYSATTGLACGVFAKTKVGQKEVFKGLRIDELSEANDKALKQAKHIKVEKKLSKKLTKRNGNNEIGERAAKKLVSKSKEYREALKEFAECNFTKKGMDTCQGWFKKTMEAGMVCVIKEGGIKK